MSAILGGFITDRREWKALVIYFFGVFTYAIIAILFIREVYIPQKITPSIFGNLEGDSSYYISLALQKLEEFKKMGFSAFELRVKGQGPAGIASLLFLFSKSSYIIILVNSLLHALSSMLMVLISRLYFSMRISMFASLPVIFSPYMMIWFSQISKESFILLGVFLFIYGIMLLIYCNKTIFGAILSVMGICLIWIMRPYVNAILMPITAIVLLVIFIRRLYAKDLVNNQLKFFFAASAIIFSLFFLDKGAASNPELLLSAKSNLASIGQKSKKPQIPRGYSLSCSESINDQNWRDEFLFPSSLNYKLHTMMIERCAIFNLLCTHYILDKKRRFLLTESIIDADILPKGSFEAIAYLPEVALFGVFSPLPNKWYLALKGSNFYLITSLEALIFYFSLSGLVIFIRKRRERSLVVPLVIMGFVSTVYGMSIPYIGALYRYRYPWWILIICLGLAALITLLDNKKCQ